MQHTRDLLQNGDSMTTPHTHTPPSVLLHLHTHTHPVPPARTEPDHERAQRNLDYFTKELAENQDKYDVVVTENVHNIRAETLNYEKLCREADPLVSGCV